MASSARQSRPSGKKAPETRRAWTGARNFSPANSPRPSNPPTQSSNQSAFPPLSQPNGVRPDALLQTLAGLTGTTITLRTKTGQHYEGVVASTGVEGDTTGITLRDARDISIPGQPIKDSLFIASTNVGTWNSGPADAKVPNGDSFITDTDISQKAASRANRELQAWQPSSDSPIPDISSGPSKGGDDETFGAGSNNATSWDQFTANEELFGITPKFDEDLYTTKLDRNAPDYKERERKALRIASEILGTTSSNPHVAEERNHVDDSGADEENKYGAVVRSSNAYVPPGARKGTPNAANATKPTSPPIKSDVPKVSVNAPDGAAVTAGASESSSKAATPAPSANANKPPADALPAFRDFVTNEKQRLTQKKQALVKSEMDKRMAELVKFSQSFKLNKPIPDDLVSILAKDEAKQQAIRDKSTKDATSSSARSIGASLTLSAAAPRPTAAKPSADAARKVPPPAAKPTSTAALATVAAAAPKPSAPAAKVADLAPAKKPVMSIQAIPPFKGPKSRQSTAEAKSPSPSAPMSTTPNGAAIKPTGSATPTPPSPITNRLNVNASSFRPNPKANAFNPTGPSPPVNGSVPSTSASPKPKPENSAPNPFFGNRVIKKSNLVPVKDDFNPFKHNKVVKAADVSALWPFSGKRYMLMFPTPQHQPQQHSPHMAPPGPPPMPPPSYEEDQAAARGYTYVYPPYAYPGQPMMPGMAPPGPPGAYIPAQFMQAIPYPHGMPPPGAMYSPAMGQMPPSGYMPPPPPPGAYGQPPNGAGRPSMPPTPIPAHAHPYYPQSPQSMIPFEQYAGKMFTMPTVQHAVPYPMMMPPPPPPGTVPQHPYETGPAQPVQMGGHA